MDPTKKYNFSLYLVAVAAVAYFLLRLGYGLDGLRHKSQKGQNIQTDTVVH